MKALLFDVFGTVVDWRSGIIKAGEEFQAATGIPQDWTAFADAWRDQYQPAMERVRSGGRAFVRLDALHRENLDALVPRFGLQGADEADLARLNDGWRRLPAWPDVVSGLTRLKTSYTIAPLSNGNIALMTALAKHSALPWDAILGAEIAQAYKPDPNAYLRCAEALMLPCTDIVMVAAHNSDLAAARSVGYKTAFVARPTEHGPEQRSDLRPESDWDFVAEDFEDLATKLGCA